VISETEIESFWRDGVVCLRGVIAPDWLQRLRDAVAQWQSSPACMDYSAFGAAISRDTGAALMLEESTPERPPGRFLTGLDMWPDWPVFHAFAAESALPEIVAKLLRTRKLNLYEDSLLIKEPGALEKTAFHQDIAYFNAEGSQICTTWTPLDPVTLASGGLKFARGSHLWKRQFRPNFFVTDYALPGTEGEIAPDFHKETRGFEILSFDTEPGDLTIHHARTLHGADGNSSISTPRRALSIRYCGDDARFKLRKAVMQKPHHAEMREGDVMDHAACPVVWRAA
jgi:ectoine hydroxylase-related dioxygenase (phytanoyl-CoA dioxygenase family)